MADIVVRACVRSRTSLLVGERKRACECVSTRKCLVERDRRPGVVVDERFAGSGRRRGAHLASAENPA